MKLMVVPFPIAATKNYKCQSDVTEQQRLYRGFRRNSLAKPRDFRLCSLHRKVQKLNESLHKRVPHFSLIPNLSAKEMVTRLRVCASAEKIRQKPRFVLKQGIEQKPHLQEDKVKSEKDEVFESGESDDFNVDPDHRSGYIAIIGKPNVGKSTLLNQMLGQKLVIVTEKPQTTRHRILGICSEEKFQMVFYDTPGVISKKMHKLDELMMQNVQSATINADSLLVVADASQAPEQVSNILEDVAVIKERKPTILVLNKMDLVHGGEIDKKREWYKKYGFLDEVLAASAKFGTGVEDVKKWLIGTLPHGPAYFPKDIVSEHPERFFVSELVREKIFLMYRQEIPYSCQVNILKYVEREPGVKDFINLEILVEKESQKAILIGKDGQTLKTLATSSRLDIEDFVGKKVFLEIVVKVKENWRKNEDLLHEFGYSGSPK